MGTVATILGSKVLFQKIYSEDHTLRTLGKSKLKIKEIMRVKHSTVTRINKGSISTL